MLQVIEHEIVFNDPPAFERGLIVANGLRLIAEADPEFAKKTLHNYQDQGSLANKFTMGDEEAGVFNTYSVDDGVVYGLSTGIPVQINAPNYSRGYARETKTVYATQVLSSKLPFYREIFSDFAMPTRLKLSDDRTTAIASIIALTANTHHPLTHKSNRLPRRSGSYMDTFGAVHYGIKLSSLSGNLDEISVAFESVLSRLES